MRLLKVQKFGGTSVGSPERIGRVADRIAASYQAGEALVVVVSAMGDTTDELIALAYQVSRHPAHREMDMLLTVGERISMALLSMALKDRQVPAISLTGSQSGIITDSSHRRARIQRILGDRVKKELDQRKVVIIAGFQGISETKEITTLGRGGSDTSAVALAVALKAEVCEIFTDVEGVFTADPRMVAEAQLLSRIPSHLMVELATRGAGVLHPRSVELAQAYGVALSVKSSFQESEGTSVVIEAMQQVMEGYQVVGVASDENQFLIQIELKDPLGLIQLFKHSADAHLSLMGFSGHGGKSGSLSSHFCFFADRDAASEWTKALDGLKKENRIQNVQFLEEIVPVSLVGNGFSQDGQGLSRVYEILTQHEISIFYSSLSAFAITVGVSQSNAKESVQLLHAHFIR